MRRLPTAIRGRLSDERGFTLIELLVTMVAGVVVLLALGTIMDVTLKETTRSYTLMDATNRSRPVFEQLENELHSACFADEETPIQSGSNANALIFLSAYGNGATPTEVWHEVDFTPGASSTLIDHTYQVSYSIDSNGNPVWSRGTTIGSQTLLTNVSASGSTPVFQYFAYQVAPGTDAAGNQYEILPDGTSPIPGTSTTEYNPLDPGSSLNATDAQSASEVLITLTVGPSGAGGTENTTLAHTGDTVSDSIVFRFTPAANHVGDGDNFQPCD